MKFISFRSCVIVIFLCLVISFTNPMVPSKDPGKKRPFGKKRPLCFSKSLEAFLFYVIYNIILFFVFPHNSTEKNENFRTFAPKNRIPFIKTNLFLVFRKNRTLSCQSRQILDEQHTFLNSLITQNNIPQKICFSKIVIPECNYSLL